MNIREMSALLVVLSSLACTSSLPKRTISLFSERRAEECHSIQQDGVSYPMIGRDKDTSFDYTFRHVKLSNDYWCFCGYNKPSGIPDTAWEEMKTSCIPAEGIFYKE